MTHRVEHVGTKLYKGISGDEKTMFLIQGVAFEGPRGGSSDTCWEVIEYRWEEPDEFNNTGSWDCGESVAQPRYFKDAKRIVRERLAHAEQVLVRPRGRTIYQNPADFVKERSDASLDC